MPTVTEPTDSATQRQPERSLPALPELFAAEMEMEKKSSNFFPLVLIVALIVVVGGTIYYFVKGAQDKLTAPAATTTLTQILQAQGPATVRFQSGKIDKPVAPQYELLAKAGVVAINNPKTGATATVTVTGPGETLLGNIDGVQREKTVTGATKYQVPLAQRKLLSVDKVTMLKPHLAQVEYSWQWKANRLGQEFDAAGPLVKSFSTWDRTTLIKSYGVDFYNAAPTKSSIVLQEADNGSWKPYTE
ncbi:MAG TPA: hypothetical protein VFB04_02950 [Terriglobales bacterium]|nr:hypothetical protein [Terriglobales bacterium]